PHRTEVRRVLDSDERRCANQAIALTLMVRREYLRATVFSWGTPLATARAISGCAALSAAAAASLSPAAPAASTFFTSVRMRDTRFLLTIVRAVLRRMRFFACGVLAINSSKIQSVQRSEHSRKRSSRIARGRRINVRMRPVPDDRTLLE